MTPDDARHGTPLQPISSRVTGCDCGPCEAALLHRRRTHKLRLMGRPSRYPAWSVITHIKALTDAGWSAARIAEAAEVPAGTMSEIRRGLWNTVRADHAARILSLPKRPSNRYVDSTGTLRRLRALAALGWPMREVCVRAGLGRRYGADLPKQKRASDASAAAIAAVYVELCMMVAPDGPINQHCRAVARNAGWPPPLAWDNIDTDPAPIGWEYRAARSQNADDVLDPVVVMRLLEGDRVPSTAAERTAALERWVTDGGTEAELCRWHGWNAGRYSAGLRLVRGGAA